MKNLPQPKQRSCAIPLALLQKILLPTVFFFFLVSPLAAQTNSDLVHKFLDRPVAKGNLVRLGDLVEIRGEADLVKKLTDIPLLPAPAEGIELRWRKEDIIHHLQLRGTDPTTIRWIGNEETVLRNPANMQLAATAIRKPEAVPAFSDDRSVLQAQRNVNAAIEAYLATRYSALKGAKIEFRLPQEYTDLLFQRRSIRTISGGIEPFVGSQKFRLQLQDKSGGVIEVDIEAMVTPPAAVVVAAGQLRKGDIISEEDLRIEPLPAALKSDDEEQFYTEVTEIVGKQLRRAISNGQPLKGSDVGPPIVVTRNQLVMIEVVAGSVSVMTQGKALNDGAVGDLVQVEAVGSTNRKKLMAQVVDSNTVQILAASANVTRR